MACHACAEHLPGGGAVFVLAPFVLALDDDAGGAVGETDGAVGFVDVLSSGSAGAVGVDADVGLVDFDFDGVGNFGRDVDGGEAGLAFSFGVERADSDEAVDAGFAAQVAVGHGASDDDGGVVDAGLFVVLAVDEGSGVIVFLCPLQIHAQEHFGPVVGIGAAVAGADGEDRSGGVVGAVEQGFEFELLDFGFEPLDFGGDFGGEGIVFGGHFDHRGQVVAGGVGFVERFDEAEERLALGDFELCGFLAVPEIGGSHQVVDRLDLSCFGVAVKGSLGAGELRCGSLRRGRSILFRGPSVGIPSGV